MWQRKEWRREGQRVEELDGREGRRERGGRKRKR